MQSETLSDLNLKEFYNACESVMDFEEGNDFYSEFRCSYSIRYSKHIIECTISNLDKFDFQGACESVLNVWFTSDYFNFQSLFEDGVSIYFVHSDSSIVPYKVEFGCVK